MFSKRIDIKALASVVVLVMTLWVSAFAGTDSGAWSLNPADFRYDMSLYFNLADRSLEDLESYEIGAFIDGECRATAESLPLTGGESCLYMRIRSNSAEGAQVEFRMRKKGDDTFVTLKPEDGTDFNFKSGDRVGMPSTPFILARWFDVSVAAGEHGAVEFEDGMYKEGTRLSLKAVADEGYHFSGWNDGDGNAERVLVVSADTSLVASFEISIYKAVFKVDGKEYKTFEIPYCGSVVAPEAPSKEGYTFSGWSEFPAQMPASDIEVTGSFVVNVYKAIFKIDGVEVASLDVEYGAKVVAPAAPSKEGYSFAGWSAIPELMPAHDIEVTGTYTVNVYKAVFKIDGSVFKTIDVAYGSKVNAPDAPQKEGYSFGGWSKFPEYMPAGDIEVTGSYSVNYYKAVFKIDGEVFKTLEVAYGAVVASPEAPEKIGHSFAGWSGLPATMPARDIEVIGAYDVRVYLLSFMVDGEVFKQMELAFGAEIEAPDAPEKEGHSFVEWLAMPERMPADDLVVSAVYSVNTYRLTVYLDDEVYMEEDIEYGAEIVITDPDLPDGRIFCGWSEIPDVMPACDVEVFGTTEEVNAVASLSFTDDEMIDVFSLSGNLVVKGIKGADLRERLTPGIYIVKGKKLMVR